MKTLLPLLLYIFPLFSFAQDYNYLHYTVRDGLPSSTVYTVAQDNNGFIYIGTDNGLVRFDGSEFKYYSTADGLPDNEVIQLWVDSKNRLWICCYNSPISFLENGVINNTNNCQLIKNAPKALNYASFIEDSNKDLWFSGSTNTIKIDKSGVHLIDMPGRDGAPMTKFIISNGSLYLMIQEKVFDLNSKTPFEVTRHSYDSIQMFYNKCMTYNDHIYLYAIKRRVFINKINLPGEYLNYRTVDLATGVSSINNIGAGQFVVCTENGFMYTDTMLSQIGDLHLRGVNLSSSFYDRDGNLWFTTFGDGIYLLPVNKCPTFDFTRPENQGAVTFMSAFNDSILIAGTEKGILYLLQDEKIIQEIRSVSTTDYYKKIINIVPYGNYILVAANNGIHLITTDGKLWKTINTPPIKTFSFVSDTLMFKGSTNDGCILYNPGGPADTIYGKRIIASHFNATNQLWCASPDTLFFFNGRQLQRVNWYHGIEDGRINSITSIGNDIIILGTYNNGLLIKTRGKIQRVNISSGLIDNLCRFVYIDSKNHIWVCTARGLSEIVYDIQLEKVKSIHNYSKTDGLISNSVYSIYIRDSLIYVGTDEGISILKYGSYSVEQNIPIVITEINGNSDLTNKFRFDRNANDITIEFSGISYHRAEPLFFTYRLKGSNDQWDTTYERSINYSDLSPGSYAFEVVAHDKRGGSSLKPAVLKFEIIPEFWQTTGFKILAVLFMAVFIFMLANIRTRNMRRKEIAKYEVEMQMTELKLSAVRAQMNPHFIFNALNSIQHFNIVHDFNSAQKYLSEFSKLIRKTLDFSTQDFILLSDEISYLMNYLSLEQMRFEDNFAFEIRKEGAIVENLLVPSQVIQPYVENAVLHGLQHLKSDRGKLTITFNGNNNFLVCKIEDNGIGMNASQTARLKKGHQSKGLNLSDARIQAINRLYSLQIKLAITDKSDQDPGTHGTIVQIEFPIKIKDA